MPAAMGLRCRLLNLKCNSSAGAGVLLIPQMQLDLLHTALHTEIDYNQCSVCR